MPTLRVSASKLLLFFDEPGEEEMDMYEKYCAPPLGELDSCCLLSTRRPEEEERRRLGAGTWGRVGVVHPLPVGVGVWGERGGIPDDRERDEEAMERERGDKGAEKWWKPSGRSRSGELPMMKESSSSNGLLR